MDIALIIIGFILIILGILGCILPVIPGPPISYVGLLLLHFTSKVDLSTFTLIFTAALTIVATILDYFVPVWGTKIAGGTKWGMRGCGIGLIIGMFFGIVGVFLFPFIGALIGEILYTYKTNKENNNQINFSKSLKAAFGSFLGLLFGIILKLYVSCFIAFIFIKEVIINFF